MGKRVGVEDPSTLVREAPPTSTRVATYKVTVTEGPDAGKELALDGGTSRVLVGKSPACELQLTDGEVSRRHLSLDTSDRLLRLTDLGSTNGTFVNGVKVLDAHLSGGENVRLGRSALRVELVERARAIAVSGADRFGKTLGASLEMRRLYPLCERLAASAIPVVIEGETGTGKEVLAESLHDAGPRAGEPFVVFDCTAVPANLIESELFGHERGAFTGALTTRKGVFEQAHGGTLFIDEIGELEPALQPKLLRAIQRNEVRRVGGDRWISVDVRVLAATRRDLDQEVQAGRFRDDLFFRLAIGRIELPPLRRRHGDVAMLAAAFWAEFGGDGELPYSLLCRWESYEWPGNIRELRNEVARRAALGDFASPLGIDAEAETRPRDPIEEVLALDLPLVRGRNRVVAEFERRYIARIVAKHGGNVSRAAAASGLAHRYFQVLRAKRGK